MRFLLFALSLFGLHSARADDAFRPTACEGAYPRHLQGICTNNKDAIYWSSTDALVKTDTEGRVLKKVSVANHHGDLCYHAGRIYVATNLAKFNRPAGDAAPVHRLEQPYAERVLSMHKAKSESIQAYIQAFGIGDLGIASIPFEVFTETGLEIKARSPFKDTFTIELANGSNGYLPTPKHHDLGGYETWLGTNRVEREASKKITAKALEMLQTVHKAP